ncbi:MAG: hypothetical protein ABW109_22110, partial [Candidatus Thiodiazotropha sp. 6PLUC4]
MPKPSMPNLILRGLSTTAPSSMPMKKTRAPGGGVWAVRVSGTKRLEGVIMGIEQHLVALREVGPQEKGAAVT